LTNIAAIPTPKKIRAKIIIAIDEVVINPIAHSITSIIPTYLYKDLFITPGILSF
jgi:hypothetical protein